MELFKNILYLFPQQGTIRTTSCLNIPGLPAGHSLSLYLPPDYEEPSCKAYPIMYLFDGQNLYQGASDSSQSWHLNRILDQRWQQGQKIPIVVGIHQGPARDEELSPWPIEADQKARGDQLLAWIVNQVHPYLLEHLPILPGPEHTTLGGSSLGGLMALYGCLKYSHVFGMGLCMSPSLWVGEGAIYDFVAHTGPIYSPETFKLYLDVGDQEGAHENSNQLGDKPEKDLKEMVHLFEQLGLVQGQSYHWVEDLKGEHNEYHWSKRLPGALDFLYGSHFDSFAMKNPANSRAA